MPFYLTPVTSKLDQWGQITNIASETCSMNNFLHFELHIDFFKFPLKLAIFTPMDVWPLELKTLKHSVFYLPRVKLHFGSKFHQNWPSRCLQNEKLLKKNVKFDLDLDLWPWLKNETITHVPRLMTNIMAQVTLRNT